MAGSGHQPCADILDEFEGEKLKKLGFGQIVEIIANLAVLAGILLVAFEINQANLTTRAELVSSFQDRWVALDLSWQNHDFASAWAKAIEAPEELTLAEMNQLNGLMWSYIDHISTSRILWELGIFDETDPSIDELISQNVPLFFGNRFAQAWWAENILPIDSQTTELINREIENLSVNTNLDFYNRVRARIRE